MKKYWLALVLLLVILLSFQIPWGRQSVEKSVDSSTHGLLQKTAEPIKKAEMQGSVIGRVISAASGEAIVAATVQLAAMGAALLETQTDEQGQFRFEAVPPGDWKLTAHAPGLISFASPEEIPRIRVDQEVHHHGPLLLQLQKARLLKIQVVSAEENRVLEKARIEIAELKQEYVTDNTGQALLALTPGNWNAGISAPQHLTRNLSFSLLPGEISSQTISLDPSGLGKFSVADSQGRPLAGVVCSLKVLEGADYRVISDALGQFQIDQLPLNGPFRLTLSLENYETLRQQLSLPPGKRVLSQDFVLSPLPPEKQLADGRFLISGSLVDTQDQPLDAVSVRHLRQNLSTSSDTLGQFKLGPFFPEGRFAPVLFQREGYASEILDVPLSGTDGWIRLGEIKLKPDRLVKGRIVTRSGLPIPEASIGIEVVRMLSHNNFQLAEVDAEGYFSLNGLPRGSSLHFQAPGYFPRELSYLEIPFGQDNVEIVLEAWPDLEARVIDRETGNPLEKFWFQISDDRRETLVHSHDGRFSYQIKTSLNGDPAGQTYGLNQNLKVSIRAEGYVPNLFQVPMEELSKEEPQVFEMSKGRPLNGVVRQEDGKTLAGLQVIILTEEDFNRWPLKLEHHLQLEKGINPWPASISQSSLSDGKGAVSFEAVSAGFPLVAVAAGPGFGLAWARIKPTESFFFVDLNREVEIQANLDRESFPGPAQVLVYWNRPPQTPGNRNKDNDQPATNANAFEYGANYIIKLEPDQDSFHIRGLPAGEFGFILDHQDASGKYQTIDWQQAVGEAGELVEVHLGFQMATLSGACLIDGTPIPGAWLYLFSRDQPGQWRVATADSEGNFTFTKLSKGLWTLALRGSDQPESSGFFLPVHGGNAFDVKLEGVVRQDFNFRHFSNVSGRVVGAPADASLLISWHGQGHVSAPTRMAADGSFLIQSLAPGQLQIGLLRGTGRPIVLAENLTIPEDGRDLDLGDLEIPETAGLRIAFDFDSFSGSHAIEIQAHHLETGRRLFIDQVRAADGTLTYNELSVGRISLSFSARNCILTPAFLELTLDPDQISERTIGIKEETGLIFTYPGRTIATAMLRSPSGQDLILDEVPDEILFSYKSGFSGSEGHIFGLAPGPYSLILVDDGNNEAFATVEVLPDRHNRIALRHEEDGQGNQKQKAALRP